MGEIVLEPGDKQKIVSQPAGGEAYNINVSGTDVYLNHNANGIVREGKVVRAGDRTQANNLRGGSLYAKNPATNTKDATIQVDRAGFALNFMTRDVVERPSDRATRRNLTETKGFSSFGLPAGNSMTNTYGLENTSDAVISSFYAIISGGNYSENVWYDVRTVDSGGQIVNNWQFNTTQVPYSWDPLPSIPEGGDVELKITNDSANSVDVRTNVQTRHEGE